MTNPIIASDGLLQMVAPIPKLSVKAELYVPVART